MPDLIEQFRADPAQVTILTWERDSAEIDWRGGRNSLVALEMWPMLFGEQTPLIGGEYMLGDYCVKVVGWSASKRLVLVQRVD